VFIDEVRIYVKAGDGGNGCMAFRREKSFRAVVPAVAMAVAEAMSIWSPARTRTRCSTSASIPSTKPSEAAMARAVIALATKASRSMS